MGQFVKAIKSFLPRRAKRAIRSSVTYCKSLIGDANVMPDFIIIGSQRCGTTSLYNYLVRHPSIFPASLKEVNFFNYNFKRNLAWYKCHFPYILQKRYLTRIRKKEFITGEASSHYIFYPSVARRISETLPRVKLIALLRNPIDRAYSNYWAVFRNGWEKLSFEDALRAEGKRPNILYRYLRKGIYADYLSAFADIFPRERILIIKSEDFFANTDSVFQTVTDFLGVRRGALRERKIWQKGSYPEMAAGTRKYLADYFRPHNKRLYGLLGTDLGWDR